MTSRERAWLAGFFDGEGNVGTVLVDQNRNVNPVIQIVQKDPKVLEGIRDLTGLGRIAQFRKTPGREGWIWRVQSRADVVAFVDLVFPYARVKQRELALVREFCAVPNKDRERRFEIRDLLLVRKGPPAPIDEHERQRLAAVGR